MSPMRAGGATHVLCTAVAAKGPSAPSLPHPHGSPAPDPGSPLAGPQTPKPPPKPVAAFLSPVLWAMERPDRFDMYSCGVCMVQLLFAHLRNDNALIAFNKRLQVGACF